MVDKGNANRFIDAYNSLDKALRNVFGIKSNASFTEVVRRCAKESRVVAKYEDELIAFSRLRNAIVHNLIDNKIIAEPHDDVVEELELVLKLVSSPPPVLSVAHNAVTFDGGIKLKKAISLMASGGFSNVPIVEGGLILGVVTNKLIMESFAKEIKQGRNLSDFVENTNVSFVLNNNREHFSLAAKDMTVDSALGLFHINKKLRMLVITDNGRNDGKILGVVTIEDFSRMSDVVFNY